MQAVRSVFGEETDGVLANLKVSFISPRFMYMGIRDEDGSISIGAYHLAHSELRTLYLDIVHELFHIKQWREDKKQFGIEHQKFMGDWAVYFSSPIEVPAYIHTVREAERLGMTRDEIVEHLKMGPTPARVFSKFLKAMEIDPVPSAKQTRLPVKITRNAPIPLYPFTDYFNGFENVPAVRNLLGEETELFLDQLKVEFVNTSFLEIIPSEDGHILVSAPYLKKTDTTSIYLDILLCLNIMKRAPEGLTTANASTRQIKYSQALLDSYKALLEEAKRLGVPDAGIMEFMSIPRFMMDPADYTRFLRKLGLRKQDVPN